LTVALCFGALNDYWFAIPAAVALLMGVLAARRSEEPEARLRAVGKAWAGPLLVAGFIGLTLLLRGGSGALLSSHADGQESAGNPTLAGGIWRILNRLNGAALDGLDAGRSTELWESLPPVLLTATALGVVLWKGTGLARRASILVSGSLAIAVLGGVFLQVQTGRSLPLEPRSFMVLLPLLLLVWVEAMRLSGVLRSRILISILALLLLSSAWRQHTSTSQLQTWAAERVSEQAKPGVLVVAPEPLSWHLELADDVSLQSCLEPGMPEADEIWWVRLQDGSQPLSLAPCPDSGEGEVDLGGYVLVDVEARGPPEHERNAASFLPPVVIAHYVRGEATQHDTLRRRLDLDSGLFSGLDGGELRLSLEGVEGSTLWDQGSPAELTTLDIPMREGVLALRVELVPETPEDWPRWSLLDPFWRTSHGWEPIPLSAAQETGSWVMTAPAFGSPVWQVLRRIVRTGLVIGVFLSLPLRRWLPAREEEPAPWRRWSGWAGLGTGAGVLGMVVYRMIGIPMDSFGDSAAQYIDHLARMQALERITRAGAWEPLGLLQAGDGMYPPLLHIFTLGFGPLLGHGTGPAVAFGLVWLMILAGSMAVLAQALVSGTRPQHAVALAVVLTPAMHAVVNRYAYDLPMTALLWAGIAVLARSVALEGRAAWISSGVAGLLLAAAALVKWTAIPFGLLMVAGLAISLGRARGWRTVAERLGLAMVLATLPVLVFLGSGSTSMGAMGSATFQPPVGAALESRPWLQSLIMALPEGVGDRIGSMILQLLALDGERLGFYPGRLITTIYSPLLSLGLGLGLWSWWREGRPGWELVCCTVLGQWLFCLLLVPPLDDRFLLTLAPALTLGAALGWLRLADSVRRWSTPAVLVGALWVTADFHLMAPEVDLHTDPQSSLASTANGSEWTGRLGLSSSIHLRGWVRSDEVQPDRTALRERLWRTVRACHAPVVAGPAALLTARGDSNWWAWRDLRERAEEGLAQSPDPRVRYQELSSTSSDESFRPQLLLTPEPLDAFGPPEIVPDHRLWESLGYLEDPEGGPGVRVWQLRSGGVCPSDIAG
jgi:hypothetical protein